jgi:hypothetical protein
MHVRMQDTDASVEMPLLVRALDTYADRVRFGRRV